MKKRIFALVLALCIVVSMMPAVAAAGYHDTDGHWAEDAIARWSEHGIVEGSDGLFSPDGELTRGALMTIIARLLKLPAAPDAGFADIDGHWAEDFINRCAAAGIVKGDGVNANPDDLISREETMVMLGRALGIKPVENADLSHYEDDHAVSDWAEGYVAAMTGAGIINGIDGNLAPDAEIDRASTMTILDRAITTYVTEPGTTVESDGGIIVVAAENVTITGEADTVLVTQGAAGGTTTLENVNVGTVTVQAEDSAVVVGENTVAVEVTVTETAAGSAVEVDKKAEVGTVTTSAAESTVSVSGTVTNVTVTETAEGATVETEKGAAIENVTTEAENTTVTGTGKVENVTTSGDNTTVETNGTKVEAAEGTTGTTAGGKEVEGGESATTTPTTPSTPSVSEHYCRYSATVTAPTCTDKGYTTYTCVCGHSYVDDYVDKLGHDFTGNYTYDETGHWHICAREGCTVTDTKAAHVGLGTVCDVATSCTDCGYGKAAGQHIWNNGVVTTAPTCSATGVKTFACTAVGCNGAKTEDIAIDANAHSWGEWSGDHYGSHTRVCALNSEHTETGACSDTPCTVCDDITVYVASHSNGKKYATLADALAERGTVTLLSDVTLTETAVVAEGKNITLKLNGKTINVGYQSDSSERHIYAFKNSGALTITGDGVVNTRGIYNHGTMTLENCTINAIDTNGGAGVWAYEDSTTIINGGNFTATESAGCVNSAGTLTINGGTFTQTETSAGDKLFCYAIIFSGKTGTIKNATINGAHGCVAVTGDGSNMTIKNGTFTCTGVKNQSDHVLYNEGGKIVVNGGTFTGDHEAGGVCLYDASKTSVIYGGTFSSNPSAFVAEGYEATKNGDVWTVGKQVIDTEEELVAAIAKGGTVTLGGDITLNNGITIIGTVTLNLNGHDLTGSYTGSDHYAMFTIPHGASLTVTGNGNVTVTTKATENNRSLAIFQNSGTLVLDGGNYTLTDGTTDKTWIIATIVDNRTTSASCKTALTITGGTYTVAGNAINLFRNYPQQGGTATLTISNGTFKANTEKTTTYIWNQESGSYLGELYFNGGTYDDNIVYEDYNGQGDVHIADGVTIKGYSGNN